MNWQPVARWISIAGHPFVWLLIYVGVVAFAHLPWPQALLAVGLVFFLSILPMTLYLQRLVRGGATNFDVSKQELRGPVYALGLALGLFLLWVFRRLGTPWEMLRGLVAGIVMVVTASLINLRLKVSLHSAFAVWVACGLWRYSPWMSVGAGCGALAVIWSRLELGRHTVSELVAGMALGAIMSVPLQWGP